MRDDLQDDGRTWWIWTCVAGVALGLLGLLVTVRRRRRLARNGAAAQRS
jgi:MYXO-CTERM domain-containing protein